MKNCKRLKSTVRSAYKSIKSAARLGAFEGADPICVQVHANAYYLKRKFSELTEDMDNLSCLPCTDRMPRAFKALWDSFKKKGFSADKDFIKEALGGFDLDSNEIDLLRPIINAAAIIEIGLVCDSAVKDRNYSVKRLSKALETLKKAEITDFSSMYSCLSSAERLLEQKEHYYKEMTEGTKGAYRRALHAFAKKLGCSEIEALNRACKTAEEKKECIGRILDVDSTASPFAFLGLAAAVFALSLWAVITLCPLWAWILLTVPMGVFSLGVADFCFSIGAVTKPCPAISSEKLPDGKLALTVITTLLEDDVRVFKTLERFYLTNSEKGLFFGVLADLPSADYPKKPEDEPLLARAMEQIDALNSKYGERFCLFVRKRVEAKGGKWCGRERKRGAIEDLVRFLHHGDEGEFTLIRGARVNGVRFLITLDGDTNLPPCGAAALCGMMLHPLNAPRIENGRVAGGYGILQPRVQTTLKSSRLTRFAALISGVGGIDVYESAAFNRQQSVFGEGIFCGKGLIDVRTYATLLDGLLPEGKVLSHDMPEGNVLRTRYVSDLCLTDSVPSGVIPYYDRLHRWIRGDTQNLALIKGYKQGARGSLRIIQNILRHLSAPLCFAALAWAGFGYGDGRLWTCFFALLNLLSPVFFTLISRPKALRFRSRRFFSSVQSGLIQSVSTAYFEISALCHKTFITSDAVLRSVIRLFTGRNLLRWVTAAESEKNAEKGVFAFIYRLFLSAVAGSVFFFVSTLWVTRLLGLLWFLFPLYAYFLSQPVKEKAVLSSSSRKTIKLRALPIWKFFEDKVNEDTAFLPPDNYQLSPTEATAMRTSPTNIGLYLLSVVAAEDFGFITAEVGEERISKALDAMEKMAKWKGHLYNWYSLPTLEVLGGGYVSTVDSGNLCVCLVALSRYLYGCGRHENAKRAEKLFEATDFTSLYNEERRLFSLGYDSGADKVSDICYDLYMSEARSTSYFALAFGQAPLKHWKALGRPVVGNNGHIGMASWSGTAFEYFMPQLFLPLYKDSFIYESLHFALGEQKRFSHGRLWGCSESAYLCFDAEMNYQYKAHGVQTLALCHYQSEEKVLSPYSVYLSLCIGCGSSLKTLAAYDAAGFSGPYGLYEAVDCTGGAAIQSYMAHHMGMSLIALANAYFDNVFIKRFMNHPRTGAFYELLQEKIPVDAPIYDANKQKSEKEKERVGRNFGERLTEYDPSLPVFHLSGRGPNTIAADSAGHVRFSVGDVSVNETHFTPHSAARSLTVMFCHGKKIYAAAPYGFNDGKFSFESAAGYAAHICSSAEFSGRVKYYTDAAGCFVTETKSDAIKSFSLVFSFDVQLASDKVFFAHPAFSRLFVTASYDKESNAILYAKNERNGKDRLYMAVGLSDGRLNFEFETNKESYEAYSLYRPEDVLREKYKCSTGVCVTPFCLIKTPPLPAGEIRLIIAIGHTKEECLERLKASRRGGAIPSGKYLFGERENPLLKGIFYGSGRCTKDVLVKNGDLWGRGLSGDYPIIAVLVREFYRDDLLFYIRSFKTLATLGQRIELVFLVCEEERYSSPVTNALKRLIRAEKCDGFIGKRGGMFFGDGNDVKERQLFEAAASYYTESFETPFGERTETESFKPLPPVTRKGYGSIPVEGNKVWGGAYKDGAFTVDKNERLSLPFSYILAGRAAGSVVTHGSLGYSFCGNSALKRIAAFKGDVYGGTDDGEVIYCFYDGEIYDITACSKTVIYEKGIAKYKGRIKGRNYTLTVFVCHKLPLKVLHLAFEDGEEADAALCVRPLMDSGAFPAMMIRKTDVAFKEGTALGFMNGKSPFFCESVGFIACLGEGNGFHSLETLFTGAENGRGDVFALRRKGREITFVIGAAPRTESAARILSLFAKSGYVTEARKARSFAESMIPPIRLAGLPTSMAEAFTRFIPYQAAACRFFARGAFYQSSGAFGFRDQLQDCMYLVYSMPSIVRTHILRCAARQYTDGGVQHWWHPNRSEGKIYGVRSKCSDDFLWLPICVAEYIRITGDDSILLAEVPYLSSPPLGDERERYEAAAVTVAKESLYMHCVRALEHGRSYGKHGLPLMGSCDWNDAFSDLGEGAESVFGGFLYVIALKRFATVAKNRGDGDFAERCEKEGMALLSRCEDCFTGDRFIRAYGGDGRPLGVTGRAACEIDALCQAFAVFAGADKAKCKTAMETAFQLLYDSENKLLRLFTPPFGADTEHAGYINAYAKGVRENGGQYTHAALWFAAALAECDMTREAIELITVMNPLWRAEDAVLFSKYKGEPYAVAADIYTARGQAGRAGWTHYTGGAAWYCKIMLERFLGVKFSDGYKTLTLSPLLEYKGTFEFYGKVHIEAQKGAPLTMDGLPAVLPLRLDGGEHYITVPVDE